MHLSLPCGVDFAQTGVEPGANQDGSERKKSISIFRKIRYIIHIKTCITYYSKTHFCTNSRKFRVRILKYQPTVSHLFFYQFFKNFTIRVNTYGIGWKMRLFYIYFFVLFTILWKIRILRNKEKIKNHSYNLSMCPLYVQYLHFYISLCIHLDKVSNSVFQRHCSITFHFYSIYSPGRKIYISYVTSLIKCFNC